MSNYEITKQKVKEEFLKYDQEHMIQKFQLRHDAEYLYIDLLKHTYRIERRSGTVMWSDNDFADMTEAGFNEVMTIYDVLCYSQENCHLANEFMNMKSLSSIKGSSGPVGDTIYQTLADMFDHREDVLSRACERLGGIKAGRGDVAYRIPMFEFFPVLVQFWNSDEEFPASLQIFVDKNALQFMHFETLWYAASHLLGRLQEIA